MHAMRTKEPKVAVYPMGQGMGLRLVCSGYMLRAGLRQRARIRGALARAAEVRSRRSSDTRWRCTCWAAGCPVPAGHNHVSVRIDCVFFSVC